MTVGSLYKEMTSALPPSLNSRHEKKEKQVYVCICVERVNSSIIKQDFAYSDDAVYSSRPYSLLHFSLHVQETFMTSNAITESIIS